MGPRRRADFFTLRTPLLPSNTVASLGEGLSATKVDSSERSKALASDRQRIRERLRALVLQPAFSQALYFGSRSLTNSLPSWLESPTSERGAKIERALVRYIARAAWRSTPYMMFAATSLGEKTSVERGE